MELQLYKPVLDELDFRQRLLSDPGTMAYNHAYGGAIGFPRERWEDWYARWIEHGAGERFYRYLYHGAGQAFIGEIAYHYDSEFDAYICDVLVATEYRGQGFGRQGLELLCEAAKANGVKWLADNIAVDNPSIELFRKVGFRERLRTDEYVLVEKEL